VWKVQTRNVWWLLIILIIAVICWRVFGPRREPGLVFVGAIVRIEEGRYSFTVLNRDEESRKYWVHETQIKTNGQWVWVPYPQMPPNVVRVGFLRSGESVTIPITVPVRGEAWRIPVFNEEVPAPESIFRRLSRYLFKKSEPGMITNFSESVAIPSER
jgi:hypothetical protein